MSYRNSILAIGIASLFIICAAAGAIIVANDSNNNNTDVSDSSDSVTVYRSFSSATAEKSADSIDDGGKFDRFNMDDNKNVGYLLETKKQTVENGEFTAKDTWIQNNVRLGL